MLDFLVVGYNQGYIRIACAPTRTFIKSCKFYKSFCRKHLNNN
nr:MAG TPA: hypothetical protein [Caudoviricetes sp.]